MESGRWSGVALVAPGHPATQQVSAGNKLFHSLFLVEYTTKLNLKMFYVKTVLH